MPFRLRSIRAKLLAVFVAGVVLPIVFLGGAFYYSTTRAVADMVGNRTGRLAQSVRGELASLLERRVQDRLLVANQPTQAFLTHAREHRPTVGSAQLRPLQQFLTTLFAEYGDYYDELILADAAGQPLIRYDRTGGTFVAGELPTVYTVLPRPLAPPGVSPEPPEPPFQGGIPSALTPAFSESDQRTLAAALDLPSTGCRMRLDPVEAGRAPTVSLVRPIQSTERADVRLGYLLARVRSDYLWPEDLAGRRFGEQGHLVVVDAKTGDILYHTQSRWIGRSLGQLDPELFVAVLSGVRGADSRLWTWVRGPRGARVASVSRVAGTTWRVVATAAPGEFASEVRQAALFSLVVATLVLLAAAGVILFASGRVSRSIGTLTAGARRLAAGDLSDRPIQVETHDEVQTLAEAFNVMTASLRRSIELRDQAAAELDALNRSLETRVHERTRELEALNAALNRANEELKELDRLKSNFLATVSHEFKTPLTSIKAFAEILHDELEEQNVSEELRRFLRIIDSESDRLARLIKNVLDLSRIESGRMVWRMSDFPVRQVIDAAVDGLLPALNQKKIQLERDLSCGDARLHADQDRIQEVLANVLDNAIKASEAGQRIVIGCREAADGVAGGRRMLRIFVRDHGHGIPADQIEKIFDRFHQVSVHGRRRKGGTGLGLAISREIAEHHGGKIWAESEPGRGSVFHIAVPVATEPRLPAAQPHEPAPS